MEQPHWMQWAVQVTLLRKVTLVTEAADRLPVHTLTFATPPGMESLDVKIHTGDVVKVCVPDYKPKSFSMSAERPGEFDITVKVYPNGRASGYLDRVQVGEAIHVFAMGRKVRHGGSHVGIVAFGVGITEALPIAEKELEGSDAQHVLLLWASRTMGDTFWHDQIARLQAAHGARFEAQIILSREEREGMLHGRLSATMLSQLIDGAWRTAPGGKNEAARPGLRFLTVGTKEMMREADGWLEQIGYSMTEHALLRNGEGGKGKGGKGKGGKGKGGKGKGGKGKGGKGKGGKGKGENTKATEAGLVEEKWRPQGSSEKTMKRPLEEVH